MTDGAADCDSAFYWDGLAVQELRLQRCRECGRHRFPPMPACPWCGAVGADLAVSAGAGEIYSWVTVHRAFDERFADDVPYVVAVVELAERCRVFARVDAMPGEVRAGLAVTPRFVAHEGWTELRFAPMRTSGESDAPDVRINGPATR